MEITEIRVFLKEGQDNKLKAYITITFDNVFVVRNIKVIQGSEVLFIAMPSRKVRNTCGRCHSKNEAGNRYCGHCGAGIFSQVETFRTTDAKAEHRDIAHPVTQQFRDYLQTRILEAYKKEVAAGKRPGSFSKEISSEIDE